MPRDRSGTASRGRRPAPRRSAHRSDDGNRVHSASCTPRNDGRRSPGVRRERAPNGLRLDDRRSVVSVSSSFRFLWRQGASRETRPCPCQARPGPCLAPPRQATPGLARPCRALRWRTSSPRGEPLKFSPAGKGRARRPVPVHAVPGQASPGQASPRLAVPPPCRAPPWLALAFPPCGEP